MKERADNLLHTFAMSVALLVLMTAVGVSLVARPARAATSTDDWPMFQGNHRHTAVSVETSPNASTASGLGVKWVISAGGGPKGNAAIVGSPAIVHNSTLGKTLAYIATKGPAPASLDAIDVATGAVVWKYPVNSGVFSSPAVYNNTVYFGAVDHNLYAVNATTGQLRCSYATTGQLMASPVVLQVDNTGPVVFIGDRGLSEAKNAGNEWAVNGAGNSAGACTLKWQFNNWLYSGSPPGTRSGSWSPPAVGTDSTGRKLVVFGTSNPDQAVYALNAATGALVWRFQSVLGSDGDVGAGPTIAPPGTVGTAGSLQFAHGVVYVMSKHKIEHALDFLTGQLLWQFDLRADSGEAEQAVSTAALAGTNVVVGYAHYVYSLDAATGAKIWRSPAAAGIFESSPTVSGPSQDQVVFAGDEAGVEHAYSLADGSSLFQFTTGGASAPCPIFSSTAVSANRAVFGCTDGNVYALG